MRLKRLKNKQKKNIWKSTNPIHSVASQIQGVEISNQSHNNTNSNSSHNNTKTNITNPKDNNTESVENRKTPSQQTTSPSPSPPPPEPIDWKPNEKCYFCVNGKLLTLNSKGELVAESGPTGSETDHIKRVSFWCTTEDIRKDTISLCFVFFLFWGFFQLDCDSDSNESSKLPTVSTNGNVALMTGANSMTGSNSLTLSKLLTQKMASMDSMAAQFAAIQNILPSK